MMIKEKKGGSNNEKDNVLYKTIVSIYILEQIQDSRRQNKYSHLETVVWQSV